MVSNYVGGVVAYRSLKSFYSVITLCCLKAFGGGWIIAMTTPNTFASHIKTNEASAAKSAQQFGK